MQFARSWDSQHEDAEGWLGHGRDPSQEVSENQAFTTTLCCTTECSPRANPQTSIYDDNARLCYFGGFWSRAS